MASNSVMFTKTILWVNSRLTSVCCVVVGLFTGQAPSSLENKEVKGVFVLPVCLTCFTFVLHASLTSCSGEHITGFINTNMPVFMLSVITATVYGYFNSMCTFISVVVCRCIRPENWLFEMQLSERARERGREREKEAGGARHLHPRGRWMEGEMEEGRDGDKWRQRRQGSVKEMEEGGKITSLHGYTYLSKVTDTAKLSHPAF